MGVSDQTVVCLGGGTMSLSGQILSKIVDRISGGREEPEIVRKTVTIK